MQQMNFNRERMVMNEENPSDNNPDSMMGSAQNLQFNIKMGQSITDSAINKSDSNLILLSPKEDGAMEENVIAPSRSGNIEGVGAGRKGAKTIDAF
mmetsp:Transcript_5209/g.8817  ORF Transcript_5209/g.8817 Transcript_5209/m.8817 type:complete len:96 (+) Transcript_5209:666-953(+)